MATFRELYEELYKIAYPPTGAGVGVPVGDSRFERRRAAIQALVTGGATEGERSAAQAALERHEASAEAHTARMSRLDYEAGGDVELQL